MQKWRTPQEEFWAGEFGAEYLKRNAPTPKVLLETRGYFARVFQRLGRIDSVIEYGTNVGINLMILREFLPKALIDGVELNEQAANIARESAPDVNVHTGSILDYEPTRTYDLVFIKGVLVHINPDQLEKVYALLYASSNRYIFLSEYYSPEPTTVSYRGHDDRIFKRDFAGELLERFPDLDLVDYGFFYRKDPHFPQGDTNWFLLEKRPGS